MGRRNFSFRDNAVSLLLGCAIGIVITIPTKTPIIRHCSEWVSTQIELTRISENIDRMDLPESNANHGDTLAEVIYGIKDEEYEHTAVFYGPYKLFEITSLDNTSVEYTYGYPRWMELSLTEVHNHPNIECSFSYSDLYGLSCNGANFTESIVVTKNAKHSLVALNGWPSPDELTKYLDDHIGLHFGANDYNEYEQALRMVEDGYIILMESDNEYERGVGFTSKLISEFANYFGLIYTVDSLE